MGIKGVGGARGNYGGDQPHTHELRKAFEDLKNAFLDGNPHDPSQDMNNLIKHFNRLETLLGNCHLTKKQNGLLEDCMEFYRPIIAGGEANLVGLQENYRHNNPNVVAAFEFSNKAMSELLKTL